MASKNIFSISSLLCETDREPEMALASTATTPTGKPLTPQVHPQPQQFQQQETQQAHLGHNCTQPQHDCSAAQEVAVFLNTVGDGQPHFHVSLLPHELNLLGLGMRVEQIAGVPVAHQTIVFLMSPGVQRFEMRGISEQEAINTWLPPQIAYLVLDTASMVAPFNAPLRVGRRLAAPLHENPSSVQLPQTPFVGDTLENMVRQRLTALLTDQTKKISLCIFSKMTRHSRSSLSLWRRGVYRGNSLVIARSVAAAIEILRMNDFVYSAELHDGSVVRT